MKLESLLVSLVVFGVFIAGGVLIAQDINTQYTGIISSNISTSEFNATYETVEEMYNISQAQKGQIFGTNASSLSFIDSAYQGTMSAIRMVRNSFDLMGNIINDVALYIGIPTIFVSAALTALVILIVFSLIAIILRFKE